MLDLSSQLFSTFIIILGILKNIPLQLTVSQHTVRMVSQAFKIFTCTKLLVTMVTMQIQSTKCCSIFNFHWPWIRLVSIFLMYWTWLILIDDFGDLVILFGWSLFYSIFEIKCKFGNWVPFVSLSQVSLSKYFLI